jgi:hypothetical protein
MEGARNGILFGLLLLFCPALRLEILQTDLFVEKMSCCDCCGVKVSRGIVPPPNGT